MNATSALPKLNEVVGRQSAVRQTRILQLDGLRGIAVLTVVLYHYVLSIPLPGGGLWFHLQDCFRLGWCGVDLFFVLSGFLIGGILLDARDSPRYFRTFYSRRFFRIFPLYYAWLALYLALALGAFRHLPESIAAAWPGWRPIIVYALFLQNLVAKELRGISAPWLGPLWSLAVEEQFYLIMPLAVRFLPKRRLVPLLGATIILAPILRVFVYWWIPSHTAQYVATPCRADALAMGVLLAVVLRDENWRARITRNRHWLYGVITVFFCGIFYLGGWSPAPDGYAEAVWGFSCCDAFFAMLVLLALVRPQGAWSSFCRRPVLRNIGEISFCIYIVHLAVLEVCQAEINSVHKVSPIVGDIAGVLVAGAATWALAKISWRFLESPMVRRGHAYKY
jgi:peptidoglycan/LPS O-acetylase OafA/YrhL